MPRPDTIGESMEYATAVILMTKGESKATAFTRSRTLKRNGIYSYIIASGRRRVTAAVHTPYYWAKFLHNGRGKVTMRDKKLAWFRNFDDDPRYNGRRPMYRSDLKKLSPAEYSAAIKKNQMVFRTEVGPTNPSKQDQFFSNSGGMAGLIDECASEILEEANSRVKKMLAGLPKSISHTVRI